MKPYDETDSRPARSACLKLFVMEKRNVSLLDCQPHPSHHVSALYAPATMPSLKRQIATEGPFPSQRLWNVDELAPCKALE